MRGSYQGWHWVDGWMDVGGWKKQKVPIELRRHFETKKEGRQLHIINGSVYYGVTYSQASLVSRQLRIRLPKQEMGVRKIPSRRKWLPTPVFLPGKSHRQSSLVGYSAWGHQMVNTKIRLIIFFAAKDGEALYSQQKQDGEPTVAQIMNSLLPNSDWNWRK